MYCQLLSRDLNVLSMNDCFILVTISADTGVQNILLVKNLSGEYFRR